MEPKSFTLGSTEWLLLRTLELGNLNLGEAENALHRLEDLGLARKEGSQWEATDYGKLLSASRRSI